MAIRTYTVGDNSGVKRLDELTGAWQSVPLNLWDNQGQALNIILRDVMTDPNDANKVFVCGQRNPINDNPGIFWSANGGVNWNKCIGDVATISGTTYNNNIAELWVVDSLTIYATSNCGYTYKSVDGGITFNHTPGNPADQNPAGGFAWFAGNCEIQSQAIHFINSFVGVVTMSPGYLFKTTDGGTNWTPIDIEPSVGTFSVTGIHLSMDQQIIHMITSNGVFVSTDGGAIFIQKLTANLIHLSWVNGDDSQLWAYGVLGGRYQTIDGGANWTTLQAEGANLLSDRAGHHYDAVAPNSGFFSENADIFSTSNSSLTGTLSEANQFPGGIEAVWTGSSNVQPPVIPGCTDPTATNFNSSATADCSGVVGGVDYTCCSYEPGPPPEDPCECPIGYTYNADTNLCEITETTPVNCLPKSYDVRDGDYRRSHGEQGTNFYPDVTTLPWPLTDIISFANPNVNNLQDAAGTPLINIQNITTTPWGSPGSRLARIGVWAGPVAGLAFNEWIGFTVCIVVPTTGTYSIGFAGDDQIRITIDGNPLVNLGSNGGNYSYTYWSVVELTLSAGSHNIEIEGYNSLQTASFAAEIYSVDVTALSAMTTLAQLSAVTIWNTFDELNSTMSLGEKSGCSCPEGYAMSNCSGELICIKTTIVPATPCNCYLATNCNNPADTELITIDPDLPLLNVNATYIFTEFPDKCWTIAVSDSCGGNQESTPVTVSEIFDDCDDCLGVCYRLVDCEGILPAFFTNSIVSGDLTQYVGQIITIVTCPETCWQLEEIQCPLDGIEAIEILESFADCATCLPQEKPIVPFVNTNRTVKPGYNTKGCSPEYVEKISCDFSEAMFQIAASKRYGITFCCDFDPDTLNIKKQLMDFKMITDPDACKTIVNECCPPCLLTGELCVFTVASCDPPTNLTGEFIGPVILTPNCVTVSFTAPKVQNPLLVTGTDCCGNEFILQVFGFTTESICIDLNEPYIADPLLTSVIADPCDCDPIPPFNCFCIQPYITEGNEQGWISGTDCDGNLFNVEVFGFATDDLNPNPLICVRADGTTTTSSNVDYINNGDCDIDNPCELIVFDCNCIVPSTNIDMLGSYSGNLCDGTPFFMVVQSGVIYEPLCVKNDGQQNESAGVFLNTIGTCSLDEACIIPPLPEICEGQLYEGQSGGEDGGGNVSGILCNGEGFSYNLIVGQTSAFTCVIPSTVVITGSISVIVSPAPCST